LKGLAKLTQRGEAIVALGEGKQLSALGLVCFTVEGEHQERVGASHLAVVALAHSLSAG
jgi:hypothetical protein